MDRFRHFTLVALSVFCTFGALAQEGFYLGVAAGIGDLDIDQSSFPNATFVIDDISGDVVVGEVSGGYHFANDLTVDVSFEGYSSFDVFPIVDVIDYSTFRVGGGYHFPSAGRISAFIKAGVSFWEVDFKESIFLNPGPEETASRDGTDLYLQLGAEIQIGSTFATRLSYDVANPAFGDTRAVKIWLGGYF